MTVSANHTLVRRGLTSELFHCFGPMSTLATTTTPKAKSEVSMTTPPSDPLQPSPESSQKSITITTTPKAM